MNPTTQNSSRQRTHSADLRRYEREVAGLRRALQALGECNQALVRASDESELLTLICETVVQVAGYRMAWVGFAQQDPDRRVCVVAQSGFEEGYLQTTNITWADTERGRGPVGTAIRTGKICVVKDVLKDPSFQLWRGEATKRGYVSVIALPLAAGAHRLGCLAIYASEADAFDEAEVQLLTELANSLAYGIVALRTESERKRAEAELSRTLAWRQALFDTSRDAIFITDSGSNFVDVNPSACALLGYSRQELLRMRFSDLQQRIQLESYPTHRDIIAGERLLTQGKVLLKDGTSLDVGASVSGVGIEGKLYIRTALRDISERRRAEDALRQAEEKYRGIFEENIVGISQSTPDGRLISVNPAFARMFGYDSPEEMLACITAIKQQVYVDPSRREEFERLMQEHGTVEAFEYQGYRKDGSKIWLRGNARVVRDSSGAVVHYIGATEEITERKLLEEQFRQAQKMEAIGQLAGGIAHDFNNLLLVISGYTELLMERVKSDHSLASMTDAILNAQRQAASLTQQLLAFSRRQVLRPKVLDLNDLLNDVGKMLHRLIGEDIELVIAPAPNLARVKVDAGQIQQVVVNLAVNARDAMPNGGKITIETANVELDENYALSHSPVKPGSYVMLAVSDTGTGMDQQTQSRIFEPFFTTKEMGKGTGLGLSIVYGVVKQSGGYIWVYSEPDYGTTFKIYLPRIEEQNRIAPGALKGQGKSTGGSETILLVEDQDAVRDMIRSFLETQGYVLLTARTPAEAIELSEKHSGSIDILLTDVVMPGMSGPKLAQHLRPAHANLKVLYVSGYTDDAMVRSGKLEESASFLQKPFALETLAHTLRDLLKA